MIISLARLKTYAIIATPIVIVSFLHPFRIYTIWFILKDRLNILEIMVISVAKYLRTNRYIFNYTCLNVKTIRFTWTCNFKFSIAFNNCIKYIFLSFPLPFCINAGNSNLMKGYRCVNDATNALKLFDSRQFSICGEQIIFSL